MIYRGFRVIEVRLYYISIITIILLCFNYIKKKNSSNNFLISWTNRDLYPEIKWSQLKVQF